MIAGTMPFNKTIFVTLRLRFSRDPCTAAITGLMDLLKRSLLRNPESQLRIEVYIVVPGQPIPCIELAIRQRHRLRETCAHAVDPVNQSLRCDDRHIADDPHWSAVDTGEAPAVALGWCQGEGTALHLLFTDEDTHGRWRICDVGKAQLRIKVHI